MDWNLNRALAREADLLNVALFGQILLRNLAIKQIDTLSSINLSAVSALPGGDM